MPSKQEVLQHPSITHVAGSNSIPGTRETMMGFTIVPEGKTPDENWQALSWRVDDDDLLDTYSMQLAQGRYFSDERPTDFTNGVVINEAMVRSLGWENPIGKRLDIPGEIENASVIGVLKDFHYESFHHAIEPLVLYFAPRYENLSIRFQGGKPE